MCGGCGPVPLNRSSESRPCLPPQLSNAFPSPGALESKIISRTILRATTRRMIRLARAAPAVQRRWRQQRFNLLPGWNHRPPAGLNAAARQDNQPDLAQILQRLRPMTAQAAPRVGRSVPRILAGAVWRASIGSGKASPARTKYRFCSAFLPKSVSWTPNNDRLCYPPRVGNHPLTLTFLTQASVRAEREESSIRHGHASVPIATDGRALPPRCALRSRLSSDRIQTLGDGFSPTLLGPPTTPPGGGRAYASPTADRRHDMLACGLFTATQRTASPVCRPHLAPRTSHTFGD